MDNKTLLEATNWLLKDQFLTEAVLKNDLEFKDKIGKVEKVKAGTEVDIDINYKSSDDYEIVLTTLDNKLTYTASGFESQKEVDQEVERLVVE